MNNPTPLDIAAQNIGEDGNVSSFLLAMAKTDLFVPQFRNTSDENAYNPLLLQIDDMNYIPVFDTKDRYQLWLNKYPKEQAEKVVLKEVRGDLLFSTMPPNIFIVLNSHIKERQIIYPQNIHWIANMIQANEIEQKGKPVKNVVSLNPFNEKIHSDLINDIREHLSSFHEIDCAYIKNQEAFNKMDKSVQNIITIFMVGNSNDEDFSLSIDNISESFVKKPPDYGLNETYSFLFMSLPTNDIGEHIRKTDTPFYLHDDM